MECRQEFQKAYGLTGYEEDSEVESEGSDSELDDDYVVSLTPSTTVSVDSVPALRGSYTTPRRPGHGEGNSYVCFYPGGDKAAEWTAGQITEIRTSDMQETMFALEGRLNRVVGVRRVD